MIGLDTNVLVRYVMQDDPKQSQKASRLIESLTSEAPGFVPLISLIELVWVLTSCYDLTREQLAQALDALLRAKEIVLERAEQVSQALRTFGVGSADFADWETTSRTGKGHSVIEPSARGASSSALAWVADRNRCRPEETVEELV